MVVIIDGHIRPFVVCGTFQVWCARMRSHGDPKGSRRCPRLTGNDGSTCASLRMRKVTKNGIVL